MFVTIGPAVVFSIGFFYSPASHKYYHFIYFLKDHFNGRIEHILFIPVDIQELHTIFNLYIKYCVLDGYSMLMGKIKQNKFY